MRDDDFYGRKLEILDCQCDTLESADDDGTDRIAHIIGCLTDAVLLLAQVIQERSGSGT